MIDNPRHLPTIADYRTFAESAGCTTRVVPLPERDQGLSMLVVRRDGFEVVEFFEEEDDLVASTTVARLDRGLGVKSRFFT